MNPEDKASLLRIFRMNCCLWGGRYNCILPLFRRVPPRYRDRVVDAKLLSAHDLLSSMVAAFEPDFIVTVNCKLPSGVTFPTERTVEADIAFESQGDEPVRLGINVSELFSWLYRKIYQFKLRDPIKFIVPRPGNRTFQLLTACCFGEFPPEAPHFEKIYTRVFDAKEETLAPDSFLKKFLKACSFPLRAGSYELNTYSLGIRADPALFYFDSSSSLDLIEFWNLRALGWTVLPVPVAWVSQLAADCSAFIAENYVPYRHNQKMMHGTCLIGSGSVSLQQLQTFAGNLSLPAPKALGGPIGIANYPRLWEKLGQRQDDALPCAIEATEEVVEGRLTGDHLIFRPALPKFLRRPPMQANYCSMNILETLPYSAPVIPPGIRRLDKVLGTHDPHGVWASAKGIAIACEPFVPLKRWRLPRPLTVFRSWMQERGFDLRSSSAGKIAAQLIEAMGGPFGSFIFAEEELLRLLNEMAHGMEESESEGDQTAGKPRKIRAQSVSRQRLWDVLMKAAKGDKSIANNLLNSLIGVGCFRIGLKLQCSECSQKTWFDVNDLADTLKCERCLKDIAFPIAEPPHEWYYRVVGPFAVENFVEGSYTVAFALRFLIDGLHAQATWIPSFLLTSTDKKLEADFGMFWRGSFFDRLSEPLQVFGECKSYDLFEDKDFDRMNALADAFPGSILVFSTLRRKLDDNEQKKIASIAKKGRKYLGNGRWQNPVVILTGDELFGDEGPPDCWKSAGLRFDRFGNTDHPLQELSDITQQLHLGMESYWDYVEKQRLKRIRRIHPSPPGRVAAT